MDAPAYILNDGKGLGDLGLERFICDAAILDLTHKEPGQPVDDEDLEAAEEAAGLALREGEAAILYTGVESIPQNENVYLSQNGAEYLEFKGLGLVGIDSASIDPFGSAELVAHRVLLGKEILVLEGLRNLGCVESTRFRLYAMPIRLEGATAPVRAVAMID